MKTVLFVSVAVLLCVSTPAAQDLPPDIQFSSMGFRLAWSLP